MNGRMLTAVVMLLVVLIVGFVGGPVFSGEHPWDSDRDEDGRGGGGGGGDDFWPDTTIIVPDTTYVTDVAGSSAGGLPPWFNYWTATWSAVSMAF